MGSFLAGKDEANYFRFQRKCSPFLINKDKFFHPPFYLFYFLCLTLLLGFCILHPYAPTYVVKSTTKHEGDGKNMFFRASHPIQAEKTNYHQKTNSTIQLEKEVEKCDLFKGRWIPDSRGPSYTNFSCRSTISYLDCFRLGRKDRDFLYWRWKPDQCELPRFDPRKFLAVVRGKTMAFVGDSLARHQIESLLCLLSVEEIPRQLYKDTEDRFRTWHFPEHNFTVMALWSPFLVAASEIVVNGSSTSGYDLQLDQIDEKWVQKLPGVQYAIFSAAQWFLRPNYLYEGGLVLGSIYSQEPNVTVLGPGYAMRRAFRAAFKYINDCKNCSGLVTFLRTFSPSHFEYGTWNTGGKCKRTSPVAEEDNVNYTDNLEFRNIQVEEIEQARKNGKEMGNTFDVLDVTRAMQMRPDGHPGSHWRYKLKKKDISDCVHWCLPGPIDVWNELLLVMLSKQKPLAPTDLNNYEGMQSPRRKPEE